MSLPTDSSRHPGNATEVAGVPTFSQSPELPSISLDRRALIRVGHQCNNRCLFCHLGRRELPALQDSVVKQKIIRARTLGFTLVAVSGGEPTIRRELLGWAQIARALGLRFGLLSNGRMLAYEPFVNSLVGAGLAYAHVSLHSGSAQIHDRLVRAESFGQSLRGIELLADHPVELTVGCVVTAYNMSSLRSLVDVLAPLGSVRLKFAAVEPKGAALEQPAEFLPSLKAAANAVCDAIDYGLQHSHLSFSHENFPLCLLPGHATIADGLRGHAFVAMSEADDSDFYPIEPEMRVYPEPCNDCGWRGRCPGLHAGYLHRQGHADLKAEVCARPNSFTYIPVRRLKWQPGVPCPIRQEGASPYHKARNLFTHQDGRLTLFETDTRDFSDQELHKCARELGQVYLDGCEKLAPDDFLRDLRCLRRSPSCSGCAEAERCPGIHVFGGSEPFDRDDNDLRDILAELRGTVLDVGCGSGRYLDTLALAAERGELTYRGIDPDHNKLDGLHRTWPWATVDGTRIEELPLAVNSYDNVLMIGSCNHIADLDAILSRLVMALRRGGTLLLVDDVPFGLLRTRAHAEKCRSSNAGFEHFRIEDSHALRRRLERLPVDVVRQRDVSPSSSNQWLIRAVRC